MGISIQLILKIFLVRMRISTRKTRYCIDLVMNLFAGNNDAYLSRGGGGLRISFSSLLSSNAIFVDICTNLSVLSSIEISSFQCRLASDCLFMKIYFCAFVNLLS